jgi:signal recognition particle receptor subunit beta
MVQINFAQKQVNAKIVYYGPGMSGKTTNLEVVHQRAPSENRGDLTSISTDGDRTLFFDYMPLDLGTVAGMRTCFQLYTVPGQVYYNSTRKLVLQGTDGVIFIADSSAAMMEQNLESLRNLEENLNEYGKSLANTPHVIQYNKRDLPDALSLEDLNAKLNLHNAPAFEAIASTGQGVFPTLKALAACVLKNLMADSSGAQRASEPGAALPAAKAPAAAPARAAAPAPAMASVAGPSAASAGHASASAIPAPPSAGLTQTAFQRMQTGGALSQTAFQRQQQAARSGARPAPARAAAPARSSRPAAAPAPVAAPAAAAPAPAPAPTPAHGKHQVMTGIYVAVAAAVGVVIAAVALNFLR